MNDAVSIGRSIANKCHDYLAIPSVIGFEEPFFQHLQRSFEQKGLQTESLYNRYGRRILMAVSSNDFAAAPILSAHVDRHGLYKILDNRLAFESSAYQSFRDTEYASHSIKRINFDKEEFNRDHLSKVCNYFVGEKVAAYDPVSFEWLMTAEIQSKNLCVLDDFLTFDIEEFDELSESPHQIIPIAFVPGKSKKGNYIYGQVDNAVSISVINYLFEQGLSFTALLTTDEEIGLSWEFIGRYFQKHDLETQHLLVLDTSPYPSSFDIQGLQKKGGVVLRYADNYSYFNRSFTRLLKNLCNEKGIPFDIKDQTLLKLDIDHLGNTEMGKLIKLTQGKYNGSTLQVPTTGYHTNAESTSIKSLGNMAILLAAYLDQIKNS
jgi:hypothetical protein